MEPSPQSCDLARQATVQTNNDADSKQIGLPVARVGSGGTESASSKSSNNSAKIMEGIRRGGRLSTISLQRNLSNDSPSPSSGRRTSTLSPSRQEEEAEAFKLAGQDVNEDPGIEAPAVPRAVPSRLSGPSLDITAPVNDTGDSVLPPQSPRLPTSPGVMSPPSISSSRSSTSSALDFDRAVSLGAQESLGLLLDILSAEDQSATDQLSTSNDDTVDAGALIDLTAKVTQVLSKAQISTVIKFFEKAFSKAPDQHSEAMLERQWSVVRGGSAEEEMDASNGLLGRRATSSVICFGSIAMDLVTETDMFPTPNSHQKGENLQSMPGGKGANEAVACGRLGCHSYLIGRVGDGDFGRVLVTKVMEDVDVTGIIFDPDIATGLCMIIKSDGGRQRTTTSCLAANSAMGARDIKNLKAILARDTNVQLIIIDLNIKIDTAVEAAVVGLTAGKIVVVRPTAVRKQEDYPGKLWKNSHIIVANDYEAPILLGIENASDNPNGICMPLKSLQQGAQAAEMLMDIHPGLVAAIITTSFGNVCRMRMSAASHLHEPGHSPSQLKRPEYRLADQEEEEKKEEEFVTLVVPHFSSKVEDAIGAADAFLGGISGGIAHGAPLSHAIVWGAAGAALSVLASGAQSSLPTLDELQKFLGEQGVGVHTDRMGLPTTQRHEGGTVLIPRWPSARPTVSEDVRKLEELLHAGLYESFETHIKEVVKNEPHALDQPIDFQGQTLLHLTVVYDDHPAMCTLLLCGAKFYLKDLYGKTPLDRCHESLLAGNCLQNGCWNKLCLLAVATTDRFLRNADDTAPAGWRQDMYHYPWEELKDKGSLPTVFTDTMLSTTRHNDLEGDWASMLLGMIMLPWVELEKSHDKKKIEAGVSKFFQPMLELAIRELDKMMDISGSVLTPQPEQDLEYCMAATFAAIEADRGNAALEVSMMLGNRGPIAGPAATITVEGGLAIREHIAMAHSNSLIRMLHAVAYSGKTSVLRKMCELLRPELDAGLAEAAAKFPQIIVPADLANLPTNKWFSPIDSGLTDHERRGCLHYAAIGHYATGSGCSDTVDLLLEWDLDPHTKDLQGRTALDYAQDVDIKRRMQFAGIAHDAFISVGHLPETDNAVRELVNALNELDVSIWWDKGQLDSSRAEDPGANADPADPDDPDDPADPLTPSPTNVLENGIRQGKPWTAEIEFAMRHSKTCIVILTKKWLHSQFCKAEVKMALSYSKPIFTVLPPVGPDQSVDYDDIPVDKPGSDEFKLIKFALGHLQIFDFRKATDPATLRAKAEQLMVAINASESLQRWSDVTEAPLDVDAAAEFRLIEPPSLRDGWDSDDYVLLCSGADAPEGGYRASFAKVMSNALRNGGIPIKQGLKQLCGAAGPTSAFWENMMTSINDAVMVVLLLEQDTDTDFLNRVATHAGQKATKCIIVPYTTSNDDRASGLFYSSNFLQLKTCCFTDWMGAEGLTEKSPVFKQIFQETFLKTADDLANITRRRMRRFSANSSCRNQNQISRSANSSFKNQKETAFRNASGPPGSGLWPVSSSDSDVTDASGPNTFNRSTSSGMAQAGNGLSSLQSEVVVTLGLAAGPVLAEATTAATAVTGFQAPEQQRLRGKTGATDESGGPPRTLASVSSGTPAKRKLLKSMSTDAFDGSDDGSEPPNSLFDAGFQPPVSQLYTTDLDLVPSRRNTWL